MGTENRFKLSKIHSCVHNIYINIYENINSSFMHNLLKLYVIFGGPGPYAFTTELWPPLQKCINFNREKLLYN